MWLSRWEAGIVNAGMGLGVVDGLYSDGAGRVFVLCIAGMDWMGASLRNMATSLTLPLSRLPLAVASNFPESLGLPFASG